MSRAKEQNHEEIPEGGTGPGNQGDQENPGGQGDPGDQNNSGNQGNPGGQGDPGDQNNPGNQGNPGGQDDPGDQNNSGNQGNPGGQGDPGDQNNPGNQGNPGGQDDPADQNNPGDQGKVVVKHTSGLEAVEDHAKREAVPASVFAAVMQTQNWAAGKRVTAEVFKQAVDAFLKAPMGGRKPPEGEKQ